MSDPTTINVGLAVPTRGSDVGTWDVPLNGDMTIIDAIAGSVSSVALSNSPVTLTATQAQVNVLRFSGILTGSVAVTLPNIIKSYSVENLCTGNFTITLGYVSGQIVGLPPGEIVDVVFDGTDVKYRNLGRVGQYLDYAGAAVPGWVTASTIPPYLKCDGTTFSAITYPALNAILGTTTLPDSRGRVRATINDGTSRITTAGSGIDGNTRFSAGGLETSTLITANLPPYTPAGNTTGSLTSTGTLNAGPNVGAPGAFGGSFLPWINGGAATPISVIGSINIALTGTAQGGTSTPVATMPPAFIGGITMIRSA